MIENLINNLQATGIFVLCISILIVVHEWGHFITAKKLGVQVDRFALGFGPTIFSKMHNGTKYMLNIIPLGGYVKMAGDERAECKGSAEEFYSKPVGHRALIVLNGPVVNFIFAYVCLVIVFMFGYPDLSNKIGDLSQGYPAIEAGLQAGDQIVSINQIKIENWTDLQDTVKASVGDTLNINYIRDGREFTKEIKPKIEIRKNIFGEEKQARLIGVSPQEEIVTYRYGFTTAIVKAFEKLVEITTMTYRAIFSMVTGSMSAKENMTGPIGIFFIIKSAAEMGFNHLLFILGVISASLAIFNLLPVIPLDGGHILLLAIEKIRGKALSPKTDDYIARVGFSLIILLAIFVFYSDFARFGWIDKIISFF